MAPAERLVVSTVKLVAVKLDVKVTPEALVLEETRVLKVWPMPVMDWPLDPSKVTVEALETKGAAAELVFVQFPAILAR